MNRAQRREIERRSSQGGKPHRQPESLRHWLTSKPNATVRRHEVWSVAVAAARIVELERRDRVWWRRLLRLVTRQKPSPTADIAPTSEDVS